MSWCGSRHGGQAGEQGVEGPRGAQREPAGLRRAVHRQGEDLGILLNPVTMLHMHNALRIKPLCGCGNFSLYRAVVVVTKGRGGGSTGGKSGRRKAARVQMSSDEDVSGGDDGDDGEEYVAPGRAAARRRLEPMLTD